MLTSNSILRQGRYRITRNFWESASHSLYEAHDDLFSQNVIICEGPDPRSTRPSVFDRDADERRFTARFNRLMSLSHNALVGVREHFYHAERKYLVSDTTDGSSICQIIGSGMAPLDDGKVIRGARSIFDAFSEIALADKTVRCFDADPGNIRITRDGEFKFLYFGADAAAVGRTKVDTQSTRNTFAFFPFEIIWTGLDPASQNAIANSYGQASIDLLESAPDHRSDIFTMGSICYFLLTGKLPHDALERSIDLLDGRPDPLIPPHQLSANVSSDFSNFVVMAMSLKREDRFQNLETIHQLISTFEREPVVVSKPALNEPEDIDLLEIPEFNPVRAASTVRPTLVTGSATAAIPPARPNSISQEVVYTRPFEPQFQWTSASTNGSNTSLQIAAAEPLIKTQTDVEMPTDSAFTGEFAMLEDTGRRHRRLSSSAVIAAIVVLVLGIGSWFAYTMNSTESVTAGDPVNAPLASAAEPMIKTEPIDPPVPDQNQSLPPSSAGELPALTNIVDQPTNPTATQPSKTRPMVAESKPKNEKPPVVSQNTPKPKKKVTVDDLISDN